MVDNCQWIRAQRGPMSWWAAYSEARREKVARDSLTALGLEVFLPQERETVRRKIPRVNQYRLETREVPLFPRYLFVSGELGELRAIKIARGIIDLVRCGIEPLEVPSVIIERLRAGLPAKPERRLSFRGDVGDKFEFRGPFKGLIGCIKSIAELDETGNITAWVEMLGAERELEIPFQSVDNLLRGGLRIPATVEL